MGLLCSTKTNSITNIGLDSIHPRLQIRRIYTLAMKSLVNGWVMEDIVADRMDPVEGGNRCGDEFTIEQKSLSCLKLGSSHRRGRLTMASVTFASVSTTAFLFFATSFSRFCSSRYLGWFFILLKYYNAKIQWRTNKPVPSVSHGRMIESMNYRCRICIESPRGPTQFFLELLDRIPDHN